MWQPNDDNMNDYKENQQLDSPAKDDNNFSLYGNLKPKSNPRWLTNNVSPSTPSSSHQPMEDFDLNTRDSGYDTNFSDKEQSKNATPDSNQTKRTLFSSFSSESMGSVDDEFMELSYIESGDDNSLLPDGFSRLVNASMKNKPPEDTSARMLPPKLPLRRSISLKEETSADFSARRPEFPLDLSSVSRSKKFKCNEDISSNCDSALHHKIQRSNSFNEASIKSALQRSALDPNLIGDFSKPFCLPLEDTSKHPDLKSISPKTLVDLMQGKYDDVTSYKVIDCRYPYEYEGGHIRDAFNYYTKELINNELLKKPTDNTDMTRRNILVFHCEFSSERGPNLSRFLRNIDRSINNDAYPVLCWPEIYLLDGGYKNFYEQYSELCVPISYKPMLHPEHGNDLKFFRAKSKTWNTDVKKGFFMKSSDLDFD